MISSTAIFAVSDVEATIAHYKNVLGFECSWTWGEPATFGSASFGGVTIMFSQQPNLAARVAGHEHWIKVQDADEMYRLHRSSGANIVSEIGDKPWGSREYSVQDLNGYVLRIAGPPAGDAPRSQPLPEGLSIERRKPTADEFGLVAGEVFDYSELKDRERSMPGGSFAQLLSATWGGVVARSSDGEPVGVLRIMNEAPGWFSLWDVAVLPSWQGRRIGFAMMSAALEMVQEAHPGAIVFLFTYKHGFYERLGFAKDLVSMRRL